MTPPGGKEGGPPPARDGNENGGEIDPRVKGRREEVKREASEKRRRIIVLVAGVFVAVGLVYLFVQSPMLDIDRVAVSGNGHVTADQVRAAAKVDPGTPLLFLNTDAVAKRVEA